MSLEALEDSAAVAAAEKVEKEEEELLPPPAVAAVWAWALNCSCTAFLLASRWVCAAKRVERMTTAFLSVAIITSRLMVPMSTPSCLHISLSTALVQLDNT
jgi:hypothetical protein